MGCKPDKGGMSIPGRGKCRCRHRCESEHGDSAFRHHRSGSPWQVTEYTGKGGGGSLLLWKLQFQGCLERNYSGCAWEQVRYLSHATNTLPPGGWLGEVLTITPPSEGHLVIAVLSSLCLSQSVPGRSVVPVSAPHFQENGLQGR